MKPDKEKYQKNVISTHQFATGIESRCYSITSSCFSIITRKGHDLQVLYFAGYQNQRKARGGHQYIMFIRRDFDLAIAPYL